MSSATGRPKEPAEDFISMTIREYIKPAAGLSLAHAVNAGYDYAVRAGDLVFMSGQVARNAQGETVGVGDFETQAIQVHENLKLLCEHAGGSLDDIVDVRMYILDRAHRPILNAIRKRYHPGPNFPCSTLLIISGLANPDFLLEIEAVAHIPLRR
jgi:2-iminobutanoate/2-iminopropanoate deaminase